MTGFSVNLLDMFDNSPWPAATGRRRNDVAVAMPLYTPDQRRRRDSTKWTRVQAVLAPVQFAAFLASLAAVLHVLASGRGLVLAEASVVAKTALLFAIMITGAFWEKAVFGRFLFAPAFFWEDAFGFVVIALHVAALLSLFAGTASPHEAMLLALAAYASYLVNAAQFLFKFSRAHHAAPFVHAVP